MVILQCRSNQVNQPVSSFWNFTGHNLFTNRRNRHTGELAKLTLSSILKRRRQSQLNHLFPVEIVASNVHDVPAVVTIPRERDDHSEVSLDDGVEFLNVNDELMLAFELYQQPQYSFVTSAVHSGKPYIVSLART
jgi:hypothetical protein